MPVSAQFLELLDTVITKPEEASPGDVAIIAEVLKSCLEREDDDDLVRDKYVALLYQHKQMLDRGNDFAKAHRQKILASIGPTKWAVGCVADQTIAYYTETDGFTTRHREAKLYDSEAEAERVMVEAKYDFVEAVLDEQEFCSREDTW